MRTADMIWKCIKDAGITHVFYVAGGGAMFLDDALIDSGLIAVPCLHEQGAGFAAIGYAQATGKVGVCLTTSGPGATNALTPCAAAYADSVPVLFISGQTATNLSAENTGCRTRGIQEVDIISMVSEITKCNELGDMRLTKKDGTAFMINAFMLKFCMDGRPGPCWLDVPLDVQGAECDQ